MAAFLVAILIPFQGERRGSTCNSLRARWPDTTMVLDQVATPARQHCRRRFGGWKVRAIILTTAFSNTCHG